MRAKDRPVPSSGTAAADQAAVDQEIDLTDGSAVAASPLTARCTPDGVYTRMSWFARAVLGLDRRAMLGRSVFDFVHPGDVPLLRNSLDEAMSSFTHVTTVYRHRTGAGSYVWLESVAFAIREPATKRVTAIFMSSRDVTGQVRLEQQLNEVQAVLRLAVTHSPQGLGVAGLDGSWTMVNPVLAGLTGYSEDELLTMGLSDLVHPDDRELHEHTVIRACLDDGAGVDLDERFVRRDGSPAWVRVAVSVARTDDGTPLRLVVQVSDVHRFKERELDLEHQAHVDPLTGVGNRRLLFERLRQALGDRRGAGGQVGLLMVDLDGFKEVNDRFGHEGGDAVLRSVAERLAQAVREQDVVARLGGDEFVVLGPGVHDPGEAEALGRRLHQAFLRPVTFGAHTVEVSVSLGIVTSEVNESVESLMQRADAEMYEAKRHKRRG